jgi:peptidyl-prolyl cis-trans isomerase D
MLKAMRKNVKALKPTLWIIIAMFVVAIFAIWGGAGRLGETNRTNTLVTIGRERISSDAYFQTLRQRLEAMKKEYSQLNKALIQQLNIPQQVLQQMVEQALLLQIAEDMKLGATDPEVRDRIISYPVFQKDGKFIGFKEYKQVLDWNRIPLAGFEAGDPDRQGRQAPDGRHRGLRRRGLGQLQEAERIGQDRISRGREG